MAIATATGLSKRMGPNDRNIGTNNFEAVLKEYYSEALHDELANNGELRSLIMKKIGPTETGGLYWYAPMRVNRHWGYTHTGGRYPDSQTQTYDRMRYDVRKGYMRVKWDGSIMSHTKMSKGAFVDAVDSELSGAAEDASYVENRMMFGDGSGRLAMITAVDSGPPIYYTLSNPGGFTNPGGGTQYMGRGMVIVALTSGVSTGKTSVTVLAVDPANNRIQVSAVGGALANDHIVLATEPGAGPGIDVSWTSYNREPFGLAAIVSADNPTTRNLGDVNRNSVPEFRAVSQDVGGAPFSAYFLDTLLNGISITSNHRPDVFVTTHGIRSQYYREANQTLRYPPTQKYDTGYDPAALTWSGLQVIADRDCTRGRVYALSTDTLVHFMVEKWGWVPIDNQSGGLLHFMENEDSFWAVMRVYHELGCTAPNRNGVITSIQDA